MEKKTELELQELPELTISEETARALPEIREAYWDQRMPYVLAGKPIWIQYVFGEGGDSYDYFENGERVGQIVRIDREFHTYSFYSGKRQRGTRVAYLNLNSAKGFIEDAAEARRSYRARRSSAQDLGEAVTDRD